MQCGSSEGAAREALTAILRENVEWLVANRRDRSLNIVMEATGYLPNKSGASWKEIGAVIHALATAIPLDWLESAAHVAVFERAFDRRGAGRGRNSYDVADALADRTVYTKRGLPVPAEMLAMEVA